MAMTQGNDPRNFTEVRGRLEEIVHDIRDKDLSLEKSLDLYEEAIRLGNLCSDLIDKTDFSAEELSALEAASAEDQPDTADEAATDPEGIDAPAPEDVADVPVDGDVDASVSDAAPMDTAD